MNGDADISRQQSYVTRAIVDGSYTYLFWKKTKDSFILYNELLQPKVAFERDTLFDVNGDGDKDLLIVDNSMNGQCQPQLRKGFLTNHPTQFCFLTKRKKFLSILSSASLN